MENYIIEGYNRIDVDGLQLSSAVRINFDEVYTNRYGRHSIELPIDKALHLIRLVQATINELNAKQPWGSK